MPLPRSPPAVVRLRRCRGGLRPTRWFSDRFHSTLRVSPCGASLFARGGKGTKTPPGVSRGRLTAPAGPPPDPRLRGIPLRPSAKFPAHKIRFQVLIPSGPLGPGRRKILACTISPPRLVPTSRGRGCGSGGVGRSRSHESGTGESGTRPYGEPRPFLRYVGRGKPIPYGVNGETFPAENRRAATQGRPHGDFRTFHRSRRYRIGFISCGGHRIAHDRNCLVGAGLLTRPPISHRRD